MLSQLIGAGIISQTYMKNAKQLMAENQLSMSQYVEQYGTFSFDRFTDSEWFLFANLFCIAMLMIYVFFIWYRDWFGKNTFIYRLFMLPTERIAIYFAKLTTIMLLVLGLIALQILLILMEKQIVNKIIPIDLQSNFSIYASSTLNMWRWLYPTSFTEFILVYALGLLFVAVIFTAILIERSYGLKGIFTLFLWLTVTWGIFAPILLVNVYTNYFYPLEIFLMVLVTSMIVLGAPFGLRIIY